MPSRLVVADDVRAEDVRGHQVRRTLHAAERQPEHPRKNVDQVGLAQSRHAFQEDVALGENGHQHVADERLVADDRPADLVAQAAEPGLELGDAAGEQFQGFRVCGRMGIAGVQRVDS